VQVPVRLFQPYLDGILDFLEETNPLACIPVPTRPAYNSAGPFRCFCGRGKLLTVPFKSVLLGAADATDEANLAAHRCSTFL
jgi:hypothetical protein